MKNLFIGLLVLISGSAMADTWVLPNEGGGQIVITDRLCQGKKYVMYAYTFSNKAFLEGCWALIDGKVHIEWFQGQGRRVYDINGFVPEDVSPKKKGTSL